MQTNYSECQSSKPLQFPIEFESSSSARSVHLNIYWDECDNCGSVFPATCDASGLERNQDSKYDLVEVFFSKIQTVLDAHSRPSTATSADSVKLLASQLQSPAAAACASEQLLACKKEDISSKIADVMDGTTLVMVIGGSLMWSVILELYHRQLLSCCYKSTELVYGVRFYITAQCWNECHGSELFDLLFTVFNTVTE